MKSMKKVIVLGSAMAVLAGCASTGEPIKPQTVNLVSEERVFEFPAKTVAGEAVTDAMITEGLIASMYDASHYGVMSIDNVSRPSDAGYWQYVAVEEEQGGLELTYANNYYYPSVEWVETTSIDAGYQVDIQDQGDTKLVTFTTPAAIHLTPPESASTFSARIPPALSMENAKQDVLQINGMTPAIEQVHTVEGDVDVSWGANAVKANFDRIFKAAAGGKNGSANYGFRWAPKNRKSAWKYSPTGTAPRCNTSSRWPMSSAVMAPRPTRKIRWPVSSKRSKTPPRTKAPAVLIKAPDRKGPFGVVQTCQ